MPQELLAGDGSEIRRTLLSMGLKIGEDKRAKDLLTKYLLSCDPIDRVRTIDRTGWHVIELDGMANSMFFLMDL